MRWRMASEMRRMSSGMQRMSSEMWRMSSGMRRMTSARIMMRGPAPFIIPLIQTFLYNGNISWIQNHIFTPSWFTFWNPLVTQFKFSLLFLLSFSNEWNLESFLKKFSIKKKIKTFEHICQKIRRLDNPHCVYFFIFGRI